MASETYKITGTTWMRVDWGDTSTDTTFSIKPRVFRNNYYYVDNPAAILHESLLYEPSGAKGSWTNISVPFTGENVEKELTGASFSVARTYARKASAYTVNLSLAWENWWESESDSSPIDDGWHDFIITIPAAVKPSAPASISTSVSGSTVTVSWGAYSNAVSAAYVERSLNGGGWTAVKTITNGARSYSESISAGSCYQYRVRVYNGVFYSGYSTTGIVYTKTVAPTIKGIALNGSTATVSWRINDSAANREKMQIWYAVNNGDRGEYNYKDFDINATSGEFSASAGNRYEVQVGSIRTSSKGWASSAWSASSLLYTMPATPTISAEKQNDYENKLTISTTNANVRYRAIQRRVDGGGWAEIAKPSASQTTYVDAHNNPGHTFEYRVISANDSYTAASGATNVIYTSPNAPSKPTADRVSASTVNVSWNNSGSAANRTAVVLRVYANGGSSAVETYELGSNATSYQFTGGAEDTSYSFDVGARNGSSTVFSEKSNTVYWTPAAPSSITVKRESDSKNTVSWAKSGNDGNRTGYLVFRSDFGGAWALKADVSPNANSWADNSTGVDLSCRYMVRAVNPYGTADSGASAVVKNTPAAPTAISGYVVNDTDIQFNIENPSRSAEGLLIQYQTVDGVWISLQTIWTSDITSAYISSAPFNPTGGGYRYRVANVTRIGGVDAVSAFVMTAAAIQVSRAPYAPTITSPSQNAMIASNDGGVLTVSWIHNSADGSPQTRAEVTINGNQITVTGDESSVEINIGAYETGKTYDLSVVTYGNASSPSPAATIPIRLFPRPTVSIQYGCMACTQANPEIVKSSVLDISVLRSGSEAAKAVKYGAKIYRMANGARGEEVYSRSNPVSDGLSAIDENSFNLTYDDWLPVNGERYELFCTVVDDTGLEGSSSAFFRVEVDEPAGAVLEIANNYDTGSVSVVVRSAPVSEESDPSNGDGTRFSLYRETDDGSVFLGSGSSGFSVEDRYAPLNKAYQYKVVSIDDVGGWSTHYVDALVKTPYWYCYWGDNVARARWNPNGTRSIERPAKKRVYYSGRTYPVSYDGANVSETHSQSFVLVDENIDDFERMITNGGRCVYKSGDGKVFKADVELNETPDFTVRSMFGSVSLSITRIDGKVL